MYKFQACTAFSHQRTNHRRVEDTLGTTEEYAELFTAFRDEKTYLNSEHQSVEDALTLFAKIQNYFMELWTICCPSNIICCVCYVHIYCYQNCCYSTYGFCWLFVGITSMVSIFFICTSSTIYECLSKFVNLGAKCSFLVPIYSSYIPCEGNSIL